MEVSSTTNQCPLQCPLTYRNLGCPKTDLNLSSSLLSSLEQLSDVRFKHHSDWCKMASSVFVQNSIYTSISTFARQCSTAELGARIQEFSVYSWLFRVRIMHVHNQRFLRSFFFSVHKDQPSSAVVLVVVPFFLFKKNHLFVGT